MEKFKILEVEINNFRGYKHKLFKFKEEDQVIVLSGPNGYGKTSFIDAIEWCLTSDVRRISEDASARKEKSLNLMKKGLIKHIYSGAEQVSVKVKFKLGNESVTITRKSAPHSSTFINQDTLITISKSDDIIGDSIDELFSGNISISQHFYDHFICSQEKNLKIYGKGRKDLYNLFKLYLGTNTQTSLLNTKLDNLLEQETSKQTLLATELDKASQFLSAESEQEDINNILIQLNKLDSEFNPEFDINRLQENHLLIKNKLTHKRNILRLKEIMETTTHYAAHLEYRQLKARYDDFTQNIMGKFPEYLELIEKTKSDNLSSINNKLNFINNLLVDIEGLKISRPVSYVNLHEISNKIDLGGDKNYFEEILRNYKELEEKYIKLSKYLSESKKGDRFEEATKLLVSNAEIWIEYVSRTQECPLCRRPNISPDKLSKAIEITKESLSEHAKELSNKQEHHRRLLETLNQQIDELLLKLKQITINRQIYLSGIKSAFDVLDNYLSKLKAYNIPSQDLAIELLEQYRVKMKDTMDLHNGSKYLEYLQIEPPILEGKIRENNIILEQQDKKEIASIDKETLNQSIELLIKLDNYISNSKYLKKKNSLEHEITQARNIIKKINTLKTKIDQAEGEYESFVSKKIEDVINIIYKKINRHTNFADLEIKRPETKATNLAITVEDDINFSNVMSTGQITSVSLSFFIALALIENSSNFKAYFMDDPIQHLDDVNILSFVDLLCNQFRSNKRFAEQLFITTCDEDFQTLLVYKMKHYGIDIKNLKFCNYGEYIEI